MAPSSIRRLDSGEGNDSETNLKVQEYLKKTGVNATQLYSEFPIHSMQESGPSALEE